MSMKFCLKFNSFHLRKCHWIFRLQNGSHFVSDPIMSTITCHRNTTNHDDHCRYPNFLKPLLWRHNAHDGVSNHQHHQCLLNRLFGRRTKKASKLSVTDLCVGNSQGTGEFPTQMASNAENISIWWRHHAILRMIPKIFTYFQDQCHHEGFFTNWHFQAFRRASSGGLYRTGCHSRRRSCLSIWRNWVTLRIWWGRYTFSISSDLTKHVHLLLTVTS